MVLPYKNWTKVVKDHKRLKKHVPVCVMELTMSDAQKLFLKENENIKFLKELLKTTNLKT